MILIDGVLADGPQEAITKARDLFAFLPWTIARTEAKTDTTRRPPPDYFGQQYFIVKFVFDRDLVD